jgi:DNA-binding Xre family transcriptional regulator
METTQTLRDTLMLICAKGVKQSNIADRAGVSRACLSKFMSGRSKYLRSDVFTRICGVARSDAQRLRL